MHGENILLYISFHISYTFSTFIPQKKLLDVDKVVILLTALDRSFKSCVDPEGL
jgi:hypothetical protein